MKLINIKKTYRNRNNIIEALNGITLEFAGSGITMILGSSGCGKTTLLNIISGKDKEFEGQIFDMPNYDYLTQEFNLLEEMTVFENLKIVKDDQQLINDYLDMFQMKSHSKKKVKYLSNGQKKRIQFIRALLHKPGLLLCDEPTSALDYDNTEIIMRELKKISKDIQIIVVTHDIALAEKYADRIIKMNKGIIEFDKNINQHNKFKMGEQIENKTKLETLKYVLLECKARWYDSIKTTLLSSVCIVMLFSVFTFYSDVMKQYDYNETFKRADNLILSLPRNTIKIDVLKNQIDHRHQYDYYYNINEGIKYKEVEKVIKENPEIIAVESYWSKQYYLQNSQPLFNSNQTIFNTVKFQTDEIYDLVNYPFYQPMYVYSNEFQERKYINSQENSLYAGNPSDQSGLQGHFYFNNILACYDLVNDATLPLLYGKMPKSEMEVVISKNLAEKIMIDEYYSSIEEIVGQNIFIGLYGHKNKYAFKDVIVVEDGDGNYQVADVDIIDLIEVKVSGISTIENDYSLMLFFNNGYANNITIKYFVNNYEDLYFHYTRFLVEPGADTERIANKINNSFNMEDKTFVKFEGRGLEETKIYYKNPNNFIIYFLSISIIFMLLYIVNYLFDKKRIDKENEIINQYGYNVYEARIIRIVLITSVSTILSLLVGYSFCVFINQFAKDYSYEMLMNYSPIRIILISIFLMIYELLLEIILLKKVRGINDKNRKC